MLPGINDFEKKLPVKPYTDEWNILKQTRPAEENEPKPSLWRLIQRTKRWRRMTKHREATVVEQIVPPASRVTGVSGHRGRCGYVQLRG